MFIVQFSVYLLCISTREKKNYRWNHVLHCPLCYSTTQHSPHVPKILKYVTVLVRMATQTRHTRMPEYNDRQICVNHSRNNSDFAPLNVCMMLFMVVSSSETYRFGWCLEGLQRPAGSMRQMLGTMSDASWWIELCCLDTDSLEATQFTIPRFRFGKNYDTGFVICKQPAVLTSTPFFRNNLL